jgi:hypothetical protein
MKNLDTNLVKRLRNHVNGDMHFTLNKYRRNNGKNHWGLICSCMDWIDVALEYITSYKPSKSSINMKCIQEYAYVSCIDIVWQSVLQLHRAIFNSKTIPFSKERVIFINDAVEGDDNEYFKHIRAVFGAHPVDINKQGHWFASWPTDHVYLQYDIAVHLYNSETDVGDIVFGYTKDEINRFLISRYNYIEVIISELKKQYSSFIIGMKKSLIPTASSPKEQLQILADESVRRLNSDDFKLAIDDLITMYNASISQESNKDIVDKYLKECERVIDEIRSCLQSMIFDELKTIEIVEPKQPEKIQYALQKLYECLNGNDYGGLMDYHISKISSFLKDYVVITNLMSNDEILLTVKCGLFNYWKRNPDLA